MKRKIAIMIVMLVFVLVVYGVTSAYATESLILADYLRVPCDEEPNPGNILVVEDTLVFSIPKDWSIQRDEKRSEDGMSFHGIGRDEEGNMLCFYTMLLGNDDDRFTFERLRNHFAREIGCRTEQINGIDTLLFSDMANLLAFCISPDGKALGFGCFSMGEAVFHSEKLLGDMNSILYSVSLADGAEIQACTTENDYGQDSP